MKNKIEPAREGFNWTYRQVGDIANKIGSEGDHNSRVMAYILLDLQENIKALSKEQRKKVKKILNLLK